MDITELRKLVIEIFANVNDSFEIVYDVEDEECQATLNVMLTCLTRQERWIFQPFDGSFYFW